MDRPRPLGTPRSALAIWRPWNFKKKSWILMHKTHSKWRYTRAWLQQHLKVKKKNSNSSNTPYMLEAMLPLNRGKSWKLTQRPQFRHIIILMGRRLNKHFITWMTCYIVIICDEFLHLYSKHIATFHMK